MQVGPSEPQRSFCADLLHALLLERPRWWARVPDPPLLAEGTAAWFEVPLREPRRVQSCRLNSWRGRRVPGQEAFAYLQQGDTDLILKHGVFFSVSSLAGIFSTEHLHSSW